MSVWHHWHPSADQQVGARLALSHEAAMAGDWIKMRGELRTHPRFLSLCTSLIYDEQHTGLLLYACGADVLDIGVMPPRHENVTARALRCVTERALHDVALSALLRVWCAVNSHCKVSNGDAVMSPMTLFDIDGIAWIDDFGWAMNCAGWARAPDDNSLVFPNFLEFNEPACLRVAPKSDAQRAKEYRDRKKAEEGRVTTVTNRHGREEKSREEESNKKKKTSSSKKKFAKPTLAEVQAYCRERGNAVDPQRFLDHYESNGWHVGKNPMKDWQAAVRNWEATAKSAGDRPNQSASAPLSAYEMAHGDYGGPGGFTKNTRLCTDLTCEECAAKRERGETR